MGAKIQKVVFAIAAILMVNSCSLLDPSSNINPLSQGSNPVIANSINFNIQKSSTSSDWVYCKIEEIDIGNYTKIDSIIFNPNMRSQRADEHCIVELYNFDINEPVPNSHVESTVRYTLHFGRSANMISTFPKERTLIGLRFRSSKNGHYVEVGVGTRILIYSH